MVPTRCDWLGSWLPSSSFANKAKVQTLVLPIELSRTIYLSYICYSLIMCILSFHFIWSLLRSTFFPSHDIIYHAVVYYIYLITHVWVHELSWHYWARTLPSPHTHARSHVAPTHCNVRHGWVGFFVRGWDLRLKLPVNGAWAKKLIKSEPLAAPTHPSSWKQFVVIGFPHAKDGPCLTSLLPLTLTLMAPWSQPLVPTLGPLPTFKLRLQLVGISPRIFPSIYLLRNTCYKPYS